MIFRAGGESIEASSNFEKQCCIKLLFNLSCAAV